MAAHIKEDDFLFGEQKSMGNAVVVGEINDVAAVVSATQGMQVQMGLEWVRLQVFEHFRKTRLQLRMLFEKLSGVAEKLLGCDEIVHYSVSSASRAFSSSSGVLNIFILPSLMSSNEARMRAWQASFSAASSSS